ncbi:beta-ketoacyl-ACP reductase [Desulfosarcina ovata subsp. sediminis]|uniref:Beta-ketoacyl-ACP reductase n=1 Tax=Desulfosarcina ovata subsp. sediminis TaxID=885957 RepID=A0A5K7ZVC0_9BACT|nr:SDR family NAD(P)-dependent oxidoreductase [Desulfosarcina ovata]BBO84179.1 beta-ketoacyl-ACP reductase [Desulfosarcina ovata subsp. sediminis]
MNFNDKVVLITGGSQGIGETIALAFAARGATVVVTARTESNVSQVVDRIRAMGGVSMGVAADVADADQVETLFSSVMDRFGRLDVLVNNAAQLLKPCTIDKLSQEDWERVLRVNLTGPFLCSHQAARIMIPRQGGSIINITSIAAHEPYPHGGAYSPSKAGLLMLTRQCAVEWGRHHIRVNAVTPGMTVTPMTSNGYADEKIKRRREQMIPLDRIGLPQDIAPAVAWLASDEAAYVTGAVIQVDGGFLRNLHGVMLAQGFQPGATS